jgi:hypothetical protein
MHKYIKRFAVQMTDENIDQILRYGAIRLYVTSDFQVTMELNASEGLDTLFVIEKHSDERGWRYYTMDSAEFDSKFDFIERTRTMDNVLFTEIKPV